jgi:hypothetical protein
VPRATAIRSRTDLPPRSRKTSTVVGQALCLTTTRSKQRTTSNRMS